MDLFKHPYIDWIFTILVAVAFTYSSYNKYGMLLICTFAMLIIISIPLHIVFNTPTYTNYYLGLSKMPESHHN